VLDNSLVVYVWSFVYLIEN